jgi:hypothetical protein
MWNVVDPLGDGSVTVADGRLRLSVPAGPSHDPWTPNNALRIVQATANQDLHLEAKFDSLPTHGLQSQGVLIEQSPGNWLRFDTYHDGSRLRAFVARFTNNQPTVITDQHLIASTPLWIRITRTGDTWTYATSNDGATWSTRTTFNHPMTVTALGPYAGNFAWGPAPAHTAIIDYITPQPTTPPPTTTTTAPATTTTTTAPTTTTTAPTTTTTTAPTTTTTTTPTPGGGGSIEVWHGLDQTFVLPALQRWINVLGRVDVRPDLRSLTASLNDGPERWISIGPANRTRLHNTGDFNVDVPVNHLNPGVNSLRLRADYGNGVQTEVVTIHVVEGGPPPTSIDWSPDIIESGVAGVVDGRWLAADGALRTVEPGYDRLVAIPRPAGDFEVTVPFTIHGLSPNPSGNSGGFTGVGLILNWNGHNDSVYSGSQPKVGWLPDGINPTPLGAFAWFAQMRLQVRDHRDTLRDWVWADLPHGVPHLIKARVSARSDGPGLTYSMKIWEAASVEPLDWTVTFDAGVDDFQPPTGSVVLVAHELDVSFGQAHIRTLPPDVASYAGLTTGVAR